MLAKYYQAGGVGVPKPVIQIAGASESATTLESIAITRPELRDAAHLSARQCFV
jgi:hypothetical protein